MRVDRTASARPLQHTTPVAKSKPTQEPATISPQETWTAGEQGSVEEREARTTSFDKEQLAELFPGIREGLSPAYLGLHREREARNPTTLLAANFQDTPTTLHSLFKLELSQEDMSPEESLGVRYAAGLVKQAKFVLQDHCPKLYHPLEFILRVQQATYNNAGYEWVEGKARLTLQTKDDFATGEPESIPTQGPFQGTHIFRRGIVDLISILHEYAHALYDQIAGVPAEVSVAYVNRALSEGFAVLLELLSLDYLLTLKLDPAHPQDHEHIRERRRQRVEWLQTIFEGEADPSKMAYAEGTELMVNLYRAGGSDSVVEFLRALNTNRANSLLRSHPDYLAALCDPRKVLKLLQAS